MASGTFSTLRTPALEASDITSATATLTIVNRTGTWYYKKTSPATPSGACTVVSTGTTVALTGLDANTSYTYKAYSDSGCTNELASETFSTPALEASDITHQSATLTIVNRTGTWYYKKTTPTPSGACTVVSTGTTVALTGLDANTSYTYKAYSDSGCTNELASETFSTPALEASDITHQSATLTIVNRTGTWYYKKTTPTPAGACTVVSTGTTVALTGLDANTSYTYKAYSDSGCTNELASGTFTTLRTPALEASDITYESATLTIVNRTGTWYYKKTSPTTPAGACTVVSTGTTVASDRPRREYFIYV